MILFKWSAVFLLFLNASLGISQTLIKPEQKSLWEYGIGFGYIHYEQYPAADQFADLFLPFPTFQYRGEILRADDREGTRAYIFKSTNWSLELSGGGNTPLSASDNKVREGMQDIPLMIHIGPQIVGHLLENLELRLGFFQAISTDFKYTKANGGIQETQLVYRVLSDHSAGRINSRFSLSAKSASKDYLETYFEVFPQYATAKRAEYKANAGFLGFELNYFRSISFGKASYYVGVAINDYSLSSNRKSPLHRSDYNLSYLLGMTYTLGQSKRESVPVDETEGIINKQQKKY